MFLYMYFRLIFTSLLLYKNSTLPRLVKFQFLQQERTFILPSQRFVKWDGRSVDDGILQFIAASKPKGEPRPHQAAEARLGNVQVRGQHLSEEE